MECCHIYRFASYGFNKITNLKSWHTINHSSSHYHWLCGLSQSFRRCVCYPVCLCMCVRSKQHRSLGSYESFIGFRRPRRENALNVSAIIPLITAACSQAKPVPDRDKELQVTQSIWGLLISVTCLSGRLEGKQRRLLTHTQGPAIIAAFCESSDLCQSSPKCVYILQERVL